jgi:hypothetical protein
VQRLVQPALEYGLTDVPSIDWDHDARERMQRVPAFVRGMVIARVEAYCRERGIERVTLAQLDQIRSRMPAAKIFGSSRPGL